MTVDFIRFHTIEGVELQGWFNDVPGDLAVIHVHGMSGNGYENRFIDSLRGMCTVNNISFFSFDNRGRGVLSTFRKDNGYVLGGSCFEVFEDSEQDILAAIMFLQSKGKNKFILQGHSLGCSKVVNFVLQTKHINIEKLVLLAPTNMVAWARLDANHEKYLAMARKNVKNGKLLDVIGWDCWQDKTPFSSQSYLSLCDSSLVDLYGDISSSGLFSKITFPTLICYGDRDIGITHIYQTAENWFLKINKLKNENISVSIIQNADHGFYKYENVLATIIRDFIV